MSSSPTSQHIDSRSPSSSTSQRSVSLSGPPASISAATPAAVATPPTQLQSPPALGTVRPSGGGSPTHNVAENAAASAEARLALGAAAARPEPLHTAYPAATFSFGTDSAATPTARTAPALALSHAAVSADIQDPTRSSPDLDAPHEPIIAGAAAFTSRRASQPTPAGQLLPQISFLSSRAQPSVASFSTTTLHSTASGSASSLRTPSTAERPRAAARTPAEMPPSVNSLPPQRELPDGVGGLVSAASFSFADSADASMSIENPDDDDMLLSEQMPIDLLETSFQIEDLTTIMRPSMMSSSSSSISSFESASAESPMPSPPAVRHRLVTTKAPTPLKQVFSLADPHSSPSKDAEQADSSQSRPQSQSQSPVRPLGFAPSQPQTDVPAASAGSPTRALSLNMSFDEHMASAGPQSQASSAASHPSGHTAPAAEQSQSSQNVQSLLDQTPVAKRVQGLAEFDPLAAIPQDWMMKFETPAPARTGTQRGPAQPSAHSLSLLDDIGPLATPNSIPKFTQRDMDKTKKEMQTTFEKEFELAQLEIHDLTLGAEALREDNRRMRETLSQWEQAVKLMIAEKDKDKHQKQAEIDELTKQLQKTREERDLARKEADQVSLKYKQLRVDVSDMKEIDERQRAQIGELEKSVEVANKRFDSLRAHAEAKLEEANVKIERVRSTYEKEIAALRAKLSRMEVQTQTLERNLQTKTQENQELTKICDDLVSQMEQMSG